MSKLKQILEEIDQKTILEKIIYPCRRAQFNYTPKCPIPPTYFIFTEDCANYYNFLMRSFLSSPNHNMPFEFAWAEAIRLIEYALKGQGGMKMAFYKAQTETFGAVNVIMTNSLIEQKTETYMDLVIQKYVDPYNYKELKELITDYVNEFKIKISEGDLCMLISSYKNVLISHVKREFQKQMDRDMATVVRGKI